MGDTDKSDLIEDGKNKLEVRCRHCESVVLKPRTAAFIVEPVRKFLQMIEQRVILGSIIPLVVRPAEARCDRK